MAVKAFLSDEALLNHASRYINYNELNLPCGYFDRVTAEFFVTPISMEDLRDLRLTIEYRPEDDTVANDLAILDDLLTNIQQQGIDNLTTAPTETSLLAQYAHYVELPEEPVDILSTRTMKLNIDYAKLSDEELTAIDNISVLKQTHLFNIIEYAIYGTIASDTVTDINTVLVNDDTLYGGYLEHSIKISSERTLVTIYGDINVIRNVPNYIEFIFIVNDVEIEFNIWFGKSTFEDEYPECTILRAVPPFDLEILLDPSGLSNPISSGILSKQAVDAQLQPEIDDRDQTGMYLFETRFIYDKTYWVTFGLVYRGRCPNPLEARDYLAKWILDSGIGSLGLWEVRLPDIFYTSSFLLIPIYDNITELTNADIYPSIINISTITEKMNEIVALIPRATDPYREVMTAAYDKYFIGVAPADINEESSLMKIHPTYRDFSSTDAGWIEMTDRTQNFSIKLNKGLAIAAGEANSLNFGLVEMSGLNWVNFVYDRVNFLILEKNSYIKHFVEE